MRPVLRICKCSYVCVRARARIAVITEIFKKLQKDSKEIHDYNELCIY